MAELLCSAGSSDVQKGSTDWGLPEMQKIDLREKSFGINPMAQKESAIWKAAELFTNEVDDRVGVAPQIGGGHDDGFQIIIGLADNDELKRNIPYDLKTQKLESGGFLIITSAEPERIYIIGKDESGVMAGVGKLLRSMQYEKHTIFVPVGQDILSNPDMPIRGMYFATHFGNFYESAPLEKIDKLIGDIALWGCNRLNVWFDMHQFNGINDPAAQRLLARLKHIADTTHSMGMKFGLTCLANEGYANSPAELRIPVKNPGSYGVEICPSIPEGLELIVRGLEEVATQFPKVDVFWIWPYDQGGCWCEKCSPWGANGYLRASEKVAEGFLRHFPEAEIWLSTWKMDYFANTQGEIDGVIEFLKEKKPAWVSGIITGQDEYKIQEKLIQRPQPERYPLANFPEISMYGMYPWGGFGATALPDFNSKVEKMMRDFIVGGWPYSEGIYEDLSKFQWLSYYWNPDKGTDDVLREYASYYLTLDCAEEFVRLCHLLESTHQRYNWLATSLKDAPEAWHIAQSIDSKLPDWSKRSWRWRLIYDRAGIDAILAEHSPSTEEGKALLKPFCEEIIEICSLQSTHLRPPEFPLSASEDNIAYGKDVFASSTLPGFEGSSKYLVDGLLSQDNELSFWANDPSKEAISSIVIDLAESYHINEIRLQFRGIDGKYCFVPSSVKFLISDDGKNFQPISILCVTPENVELGPFVDTVCIPDEGSTYSPRLWRYKPADASTCARFIKVELGTSQRKDEPYAGTIELTEIEISGK